MPAQEPGAALALAGGATRPGSRSIAPPACEAAHEAPDEDGNTTVTGGPDGPDASRRHLPPLPDRFRRVPPAHATPSARDIPGSRPTSSGQEGRSVVE